MKRLHSIAGWLALAGVGFLIGVLVSSLNSQPAEPAAAPAAVGHIVGQNAAFSKPVENRRRTIDRVEIVWMPSLKGESRCYLDVGLPGRPFVDVPEDWCEGMR